MKVEHVSTIKTTLVEDEREMLKFEVSFLETNRLPFTFHKLAKIHMGEETKIRKYIEDNIDEIESLSKIC